MVNSGSFPVTQNKFYAPILGLLAMEQQISLDELRQKLIERLKLKQSDLKIKLESGDTVFENRFSWARNDLRRFGYITTPEIGHFRITPLGLSFYKSKQKATKRELIKKAKSSNGKSSTKEVDSTLQEQVQTDEEVTVAIAEQHNDTSQEQSPDERMQIIIKEIKDSLPDTLLSLLRSNTSDFFEKVANEVIQKMCNGKAIIPTGGAGDGGIDGIIYEDELGFERIYVQSKRYHEGKDINELDLRSFVGSLDAQHATKGVYVTASAFHINSVKYVNSLHNAKVRLIDGKQLVELMQRYGIGLKISNYTLVQIDDKYFKED